MRLFARQFGATHPKASQQTESFIKKSNGQTAEAQRDLITTNCICCRITPLISPLIHFSVCSAYLTGNYFHFLHIYIGTVVI